MANQITVTIDVDNKQAKKALNDFVKTTQGVEKGVKKSFGKMDAAIASFAGNLAANLTSRLFRGFISGIINTGKAAIQQAAKIETLTTQIGTLTGSVESAQEILEDLQQFAATTPFQLAGLAESTKLLLAFGKTQEEIIPTLTVLGDVAAGSGADLRELTRIFGQVSAAGKLTGERLLQLEERAIPIGPAIAKTLGVAESSIRDMISAGEVTTEVFEEAFGLLNKEGGKFANGMIRQSKTFTGVMSTLSDNLNLVLNDVGQELLPIVKDMALITIDWIQANRDLIKSFATKHVGNLKTALEGMLQIAETTITFFSDIDEAASGAKIAFEEFTGVVNDDTLSGAITNFNLLKTELEETEKFLQELDKAPNFIKGTLLSRDIDQGIAKINELNLKLLASQAIIDGFTADATTGQKEDTEGTETDSFEKFLNKIKMEQEAQTEADALKIEQQKAFRLLQEELDLEFDELERLRKLEKGEEELAAIGILQEAIIQKKAALLLKEGETTNSIQKKLDGQKLKDKKKFEDAKLALEKKKETEKTKAKKTADDLEVKNRDETLSTIEGLQSSSNKTLAGIGKAAAIGRATINTIEGVTKAIGGSGIPFPANIVAGALVGAAGAVQIAKIAGVKGFAEGGVVGGSSFSGDRVLAGVNSGEMILNKQQQAGLFNQLGAEDGAGGAITINVEGNVMADSDEQVDNLVGKIRDSLEFRNTVLT